MASKANSVDVVVMLDWWRRSRESQHSHHNIARVYRWMTWCVEGPSIIIPFCLGAVALAFIGEQMTSRVKVTFGVLGFLSSLFSVCHMYFRFNELAEKHTRLGAEYGIIRRKIESMFSSAPDFSPISDQLERIREELDELALEQPVVPAWMFNKTLETLKGKPEPDTVRSVRELLAPKKPA